MKTIKTLLILASLHLSITIFAEEEDLAFSYGDEDFVSIATGQSQLISKAPAVASVITAKDIKAMGATDIDEVLETVPGLHVAVNEFYSPIYTIRGIYSKFNPQVLVLVNGISISNLYLGNRGAVWAGMPVEAVARIEIIRGPGSAVYGADAFAGIINIITKDESHINGVEVGVGGGSFDTKSTWVNYGKDFSKFNLSASLQYLTTDGHKETISSDSQSNIDAISSTNFSLAPGSANLSRDGIDLRLNLNKGFWNTRLGIQERKNIGTGAGVAEALDPNGKFKITRRNFDIAYNNPDITENWSFESQVSYFHITQEVEENLILFPSNPLYPEGIIGNPEVFEDHLRFNTSAFYKGFNKHTIRVGAGYHDAEISKVQESRNIGPDGSGNLILPGSPIVNVDDTPFSFIPEGNRKNKYAFIQDVWKFSNDWELTSGIRYDDYSDFGSTVNPRLALVWSTKRNLTTKFLYGNAFRAPSFSETSNRNNPIALGNPDLSPEEIETFEIAIDYKVNYDTRLGINLFRYNSNDIINPAPLIGNIAQNEGKQTGKGIEIEFDQNISSSLKLIINYAYQDSTEKNTNSDAPNSPEQQIYSRLDWKLSNSYTIVSQVNYVIGRNRPFGDIRENIDDYKVFNLGLNYKSSENPFEARVIARNIFDEKAFEPASVNIQNDLPLAGKSIYLDIRYTFK